jgi:hypothetical protein
LRLEASRETWRDEDAAERQRGSFEKSWGHEEGRRVAYKGD